MLLPVRVHLPGINEETFIGTAFLVAFNYVVLLCGFFTAISFDSLLFVVIANMPFLSGVIIGQLCELTEALLEPDVEICDIKRRTLDIIMMFMKTME